MNSFFVHVTKFSAVFLFAWIVIDWMIDKQIWAKMMIYLLVCQLNLCCSVQWSLVMRVFFFRLVRIGIFFLKWALCCSKEKNICIVFALLCIFFLQWQSIWSRFCDWINTKFMIFHILWVKNGVDPKAISIRNMKNSSSKPNKNQNSFRFRLATLHWSLIEKNSVLFLRNFWYEFVYF